MVRVFSNCFSLKELPDISKWNTGNVYDMTGLLENCISLGKLPNISNWDVHNLENVDKIFFNCSSLVSLPDISKWNFSDCFKRQNIFENTTLSTDSFSLNSDSKTNHISSKWKSTSRDNNSESLLNNEGNKSNIYFNINFFDKQYDNNEKYYEDFYS